MKHAGLTTGLVTLMLMATGCGGHGDGGGGAPRAELVVHGGTIVTMDPARPRAEVLVIQGGRVVEVGGADLAAHYPGVARLDLGGATLVPGLIDAHAHFVGLGQALDQLDLRDAADQADLVQRAAAAAALLPDGDFVLGRGWNQELWPDEQMPTHAALSAATPRHPVLLRRVDGHATFANALAMELSGITAQTPDPAGGEILRGADGAPTGVFVDAAASLLVSPPHSPPGALERRILLAQEACLAAGLTGVHDAGLSEEALSALERLDAEGQLKVRVAVMLEADFDAELNAAPWLAARLARGRVAGSTRQRVSVFGVKVYADGALGSRGAALLAAYADRPGASGLLQVDRAHVAGIARACRAVGLQCCVHAIGDAANRLALDAFEDALGADAGASDHRFRIEHAQVIALDDIPRFARLGVIASVQPTHATSDMNMAEERLGAERLRGAYAWRSLVNAGARLALGSDFPVEGVSPLAGLHAAVTRQDAGDQPPAGWHAEEALSAEEALAGFTRDAAFAAFDEGRLGRLAAGMDADFVVLSLNPLDCQPERLHQLQVRSTWIAGAQVHVAR